MSTREELTRQAEKCLRQGRLDEAIPLYQDLAVLAPIDWGAVKQLADLLERAGQREGAAAQFARWADHLFAEGFHSKAAALFKKVLKLEPNHEHALWQLGEVSTALKLLADARVAFTRVAELRLRRNDAAGADQARRRLAALDGTTAPPSLSSGVPLAPPPPRVVVAAVAPTLAPAVPPVEVPLGDVIVAGASAPPVVVAPAPLAPRQSAVAESAEARLARLRDAAMRAEVMLAPDAHERWLEVLEADPGDTATRFRLVRRALERRDFDQASHLAAPLEATDDAALAVLVEVAFAAGRRDDLAHTIAARVRAGATVSQVLSLVEALSRRNAGAAGAVIAAAAAAWCAMDKPSQAAAAFDRGDALGLLDTPLYLQWVETCVDASLPALSRAQLALAEAYLTSGRTAEARAMAEDVCLREGGAEPARAVLLRALERDGVADPHEALAALLSPPAKVGPVDSASDPSDTPWSTISLDDDAFLGDLVTATGTDLDLHAPRVDAPVADATVATLDDWLGPAVPQPQDADAPPPAAMSRGDFDWADLLGRDVDDAEPAAGVPVEDTEALPDAYTDAPGHPVAADAPVPTMEPQLSASAAPEPEAMSEPEPVPEPEFVAYSAPVVAAPAEHASLEESLGQIAHASGASAATRGDAVEEGAGTPPEPDANVVPSEPVPARVATIEAPLPPTDGVSLLASIEELRAQPTFVPAMEPALPVMLTPRAWLGGGDDAPAAGPRQRHPDDAYLFEDPSPAPPFARRPVVAASEPVPPPVPPPEPDGELIPEPPAPAAPGGVIDEEIDLTELLEELKLWDPVLPEPRQRPDATAAASDEATAERLAETVRAATASPAPPTPSNEPPAPPAGAEQTEAGRVIGAAADEDVATLDAAFVALQRDSDGRVIAEQLLAAGRVFLAAGLTAEAARAFDRASGEPRSRFEAAQALAELHQSRGQLEEAVRWFEKAAAAPVPDAAVKRPVLYDLAESLEALGESDRALGVLLDLLSQVEDYRDARVRLDRLLRVDAGG